MRRLLTGALKVEQLTIQISGLPTSLQGLKLVQLSDFHFDGKRLAETLLAEAIATTNAADPDLIVLTGDFVTKHPTEIYSLVPWLKGLQSHHGIYAALGNHDNRYRQSRSTITSALQAIGIQVLWNEVTYPFGADLALVGLADYWSTEFKPALVMETIADQVPRIVLSHNPDSAEKLQPWRVDLQLSGHTHGGQVVIPGVGNLSQRFAMLYRKIPKRSRRYVPFLKTFHTTLKRWEWASGFHTIGTNQLYVNRGLGTYSPGRFCCPPEVTVITLKNAVNN